MINPGLPKLLWTELDGRLWHATSHQGLIGIIEDEFIRVSRSDRYTNSICRNLECVSLFDFGPGASEQNELMFSNWYPWLGPEYSGRCAIWLEIDRARVANNLTDPKALIEIVRATKNKGRFFAGVEACHKGPISGSAVIGALVLDCRNHLVFRRCIGSLDNISRFLGD